MLQIRAIVERMNQILLDVQKLQQSQSSVTISELEQYLSKDYDSQIEVETKLMEVELSNVLLGNGQTKYRYEANQVIELNQIKSIGSVIMGDLNSTAETPIVEYLTK